MTYEHSHYGIYALIINADEKKILLIKKTRGPYTGMLDLPGGGPEKNETREQTLIREVKEEVGANVTSIKEERGFTIKYEYHDQKQDCVLIHSGLIFPTQIDDNIIEKMHSSDTAGCIWVPIESVLEEKITPPVREATAAGDIMNHPCPRLLIYRR